MLTSLVKSVTSVAARVAEEAGAVVGIRVGTEEPSYTSESLVDGVEIRHYGPRIAAETTVSGDEASPLSAGFRRLAGYIFGGNHDNTKIAMTAPVAQQRGRQIAMTAPVSQTAAENGYAIRFFMPSQWTMDTLPTPNDDRVTLVTVAPETVAVLRFTGERSTTAVAARTEQLLNTLRSTDFEPAGEPVGWFYDPPWTLPFRRRNEVAVPVARVGAQDVEPPANGG